MINNNVSLSVAAIASTIPALSPQLPDAAANGARENRFIQKSGTETPDRKNGPRSQAAVTIANLGGQAAINAQEIGPAKNETPVGLETDNSSEKEKRDNGELTEEEKEIVADLKERDREVRAHEAAHKTAGGAYAGTPRLDYETGPDGKRYAVSGEVSIDTSPVQGNPEATIAKLRTVKKAALAPAQPSGQDQRVAAAAQAAIAQAQAELAAERNQPEEGESLTIGNKADEAASSNNGAPSPFPGQESTGQSNTSSFGGNQAYQKRDVSPQLSLIA